jgi:phospholipase/carboxylesterase
MMGAMSNFETKQIAGLQTHILNGRPLGRAVVLFHGFGADYNDLIPLAEMMGLSSDTTFYFPNGVQEAIIGPGMTGRAWFQIDMARIEQAMIKGQHFDLSTHRPGGLDRARDKVGQFYSEICSKHKQVYIGGFSQGAMLATEIAFTASRKPDGLVLMSGALIDEKNWKVLAKTCSGMRFIQSHGKNDVILGYQFAERLYDLLIEAGLEGEFISFSGGHEIPPKVISQISEFLS